MGVRVSDDEQVLAFEAEPTEIPFLVIRDTPDFGPKNLQCVRKNYCRKRLRRVPNPIRQTLQPWGLCALGTNAAVMDDPATVVAIRRMACCGVRTVR